MCASESDDAEVTVTFADDTALERSCKPFGAYEMRDRVSC